MTLKNAKITDTGEYECKLQQFPELFVRQYIYVYGTYITNLFCSRSYYPRQVQIQIFPFVFYTAKKDLVFFSESLEKFKFKQGQRKEIPCKPTHPDVRVTVKRTNRFRATNENLSKVSVWSLS
jgi:hypothetical protein